MSVNFKEVHVNGSGKARESTAVLTLSVVARATTTFSVDPRTSCMTATIPDLQIAHTYKARGVNLISLHEYRLYTYTLGRAVEASVTHRARCPLSIPQETGRRGYRVGTSP